MKHLIVKVRAQDESPLWPGPDATKLRSVTALVFDLWSRLALDAALDLRRAAAARHHLGIVTLAHAGHRRLMVQVDIEQLMTRHAMGRVEAAPH